MRRFESMLTPLLLIMALISSLVLAPSVEAQGAPDKKLGWADSAELSYVATAGNSEARTLGFRNTLSRVWPAAELTFEVKGLRADTANITRNVDASGTGVVKSSDSEVSAENYLVRTRYNRRLSRRTFWFATGGWDRNEFAGVRNRFQASGGIGNNWFESETARFRSDYGLSITHQEDVTPGPEGDDTFAGLRASLSYWRKLTDNTSFGTDLTVDESLRETEDVRMEWTSFVTVTMTNSLALKVSWELLFDNQPALVTAAVVAPDGTPLGRTTLVRADELDTSLTTALVINF